MTACEKAGVAARGDEGSGSAAACLLLAKLGMDRHRCTGSGVGLGQASTSMQESGWSSFTNAGTDSEDSVGGCAKSNSQWALPLVEWQAIVSAWAPASNGYGSVADFATCF